MSYLRYLCLLTHSGVQHIFVVFSLGCIRRVAMLPASLEFTFVIAPSVFSNVYLFETTTYFTYMSGCSICYSSSIQVTNEEHMYALYS